MQKYLEGSKNIQHPINKLKFIMSWIQSDITWHAKKQKEMHNEDKCQCLKTKNLSRKNEQVKQIQNSKKVD